jgi:hypothetical protein
MCGLQLWVPSCSERNSQFLRQNSFQWRARCQCQMSEILIRFRHADWIYFGFFVGAWAHMQPPRHWSIKLHQRLNLQQNCKWLSLLNATSGWEGAITDVTCDRALRSARGCFQLEIQGVALSPEDICTERTVPWGRPQSEGHTGPFFVGWLQIC